MKKKKSSQSAIRWKRSWNDEVERAESRNFIDIWPYLGDFIYRGMIRRMLIQPMLGGARKIVPGRIFAYYHNISSKYADNRVYKMVSPLEPALSSYVNNKFEQGVFWGLKKSFDVFVDNFVEFVKKKKWWGHRNKSGSATGTYPRGLPKPSFSDHFFSFFFFNSILFNWCACYLWIYDCSISNKRF